MYINAQIVNQSIIFNFKSLLLYIWYIYVAIFFYRCLLFQVENLNVATNLENYNFYVMLITCKCTTLCKKLDCDTKNEPPYFATTWYGKDMMIMRHSCTPLKRHWRHMGCEGCNIFYKHLATFLHICHNEISQL
jgi:hypothetical protein